MSCIGHLPGPGSSRGRRLAFLGAAEGQRHLSRWDGLPGAQPLRADVGLFRVRADGPGVRPGWGGSSPGTAQPTGGWLASAVCLLER